MIATDCRPVHTSSMRYFVSITVAQSLAEPEDTRRLPCRRRRGGDDAADGSRFGGRSDPGTRAMMTTIARRLLIDLRARCDVESSYASTIANLPASLEPSAEDRLLIQEALLRVDAILENAADQGAIRVSPQPDRRLAPC